MAVIVSQQQNEVEHFQEKGLDIGPHRVRMVKEDMETKFKDADDPFRLVFVCAMWLTGFDSPSVSTIYLDKPMKNHTLMQTIARANRVFKDKHNGLIVDYVGVFRNLEKALAIYGSSSGGGVEPGQDGGQLLARFRAQGGPFVGCLPAQGGEFVVVLGWVIRPAGVSGWRVAAIIVPRSARSKW